jgi:glycerol-3-phosphate dehydrogenase
LPGGDFAAGGAKNLVAETRRAWPFLAESHARRLVAAYGTRVKLVLDGVARPQDLGPRFGPDLTGAEIRYLMRHEWAETADDVLWRRSKLGLRVSSQEHEQLAKFMADAIGSSG